jgi:YD repeat-containing protein
LNRPVKERINFASTEYVTNYKYTGRDVEITDPRQTVVKKTLSAFGDVGETSVALDDQTTLKTVMRYAALGGLKSFKDANLRETTFEVDALGRTVSATYPTSPAITEQFGYDGEGYLTSHTDRRGVVTSMTYDAIGRPLVTTTGGIDVLTESYDDNQRKLIKTDAMGHATVCQYDGLMRLAVLTNPDGKSMTYEYDGVNLIKQSDFKNKKTEFAYDAINRLTEITDRSRQLTTLTHTDNSGHTIDITDRRGTHRVEAYDPLERLKSVTYGSLPLATYEYDGNNNLTAMLDGRLNRDSYSYDRANRLTSIDHAGLQTERFTYDGVGNVVRYNDGAGGDIVNTYDALDHLTSSTDGEGNATRFRFDGEGLLVEQIRPKGGADGSSFKTGYEYNALRSLTQVTDANGKVWVYGYNDDQTLASLKDPVQHTTSYIYDSLHRLKQVVQPGNLITGFNYDENDELCLALPRKWGVEAIEYMGYPIPNFLEGSIFNRKQSWPL